MHFVTPSDPILTGISQNIPLNEISSVTVQGNIDTMLRVAYGEQKDRTKPVLVGLAAPQIGIPKRIILADTAADGLGNVAHLEIFINPEITFESKEKEEWYEGCYSTDRICGIVARPKTIRLKAYDRRGKSVVGEYNGYVARILQHEIDHLNGKVFVDHITDESNLHWVEKDEFPLYRDREAWRNWPRKCTREQWKRIKKPGNS